MKKQATCAERITEHWKSRKEWFKELADKANSKDEEEKEQGYNEWSESPLCITKEVSFRIDLSTGGPGDYLRAVCSKDQHGYEIDEIYYHFLDWFDGAEIKLRDSDFEVAERYMMHFIECAE